MEFTHIQGLDLHIDDSIHEICKTSNATSGSTRSVLYVLMLVCILAIISVVNSYQTQGLANWTSSRIAKNVRAIDSDLQSLPYKKGDATNSYDSAVQYFNLEITKKRLENNLRNEMENVHLVRIPVLGNSFDINDLGLIGGIAIFILMIIIRFTLTREANNLKIALTAVTERYTDGANADLFTDFLPKGETKKEEDNLCVSDMLASINYIRRQHHYNFLSMNEIFNLPPLEVSEPQEKSTLVEKAIMQIFWFPSIIYSLVVINDVISISDGWDISRTNTIFLTISETVFLILILYGSFKITRMKQTLYDLYANFKKNGYRYDIKQTSS